MHSVLVTVVEIGDVSVGVHDFSVRVHVGVTSGEAVGMHVVVMPIAVVVLVGVLHRVVVMLVEMR